MRQEYAEQVSAKIIEQLQQEAAPWQRPWKPGELRLPFNSETGKEYRGINALWLQAQGHSDPRWLTASQAKAADAEIKPGEKGTEITYWKFHEDQKVKDENGHVTTQRVELDQPRMFSAVVYNAEQTTGLPPLEARLLRPEFAHHETEAISAKVAEHVQQGKGRAGPLGSLSQAKEELRAEMASLFLSERLDLDHKPKHPIAYIESWVKALKNDPKEIFRAAADAEKIVSHVMNNEQQLEHTAVTIDHTPPEKPMPERTYLAVPFKEKDEAKKAGAKWDKQAKSWYAPEGVDQSALSRWLPSNVNVVKPLARTPEESFANALRDAGLVIDGTPIMDGKVHRVSVEGDRGGKTSGAYAGHLEGRIPGGYIENFKTAERINWKYEGKIDSLTPQERAKLEEEAKVRLEARRAAEAYKHEHAAEAARALWNASYIATADNPYCKEKGITSFKNLRTVPPLGALTEHAADLGIKIASNPKEAQDMRKNDPEARVFVTGDLLIPGRDQDGVMWTVQTVNPNFKGFMKGSRKHGVSSMAGGLHLSPSAPAVVVEGYATGDTVSRLLDHPVVVAFDSGNLDPVVKGLRERYPAAIILIAADNDHTAEKNIGAQKAQEAAQKYGADVILPPFAQGEKGSDWNDYARIHGDEAARKTIEKQMIGAKIEAIHSKEKQNVTELPKRIKTIEHKTVHATRGQDIGI